MATSPRHYLHNLATPRADSEALLLGRLIHALVFEPDQVGARYVTAPRFHRGMLDANAISKGYAGGKNAAAEWDAENVGREIIEADMMARARGMCESLLSDPVTRPLVTEGYAEHKIEWTDAATSIQCRGRVDRIDGELIDLKSTRNITRCEIDSARFGYAGQISWYFDGLRAAGIETRNAPCLVFVESEPPYDTQVLTFDPDDLAVGRRVYKRCLDRLSECRLTGRWPGVSNGVARRVVLPAWADPIMDEEMEVTVGGHAVKL